MSKKSLILHWFRHEKFGSVSHFCEGAPPASYSFDGDGLLIKKSSKRWYWHAGWLPAKVYFCSEEEELKLLLQELSGLHLLDSPATSFATAATYSVGMACVLFVPEGSSPGVAAHEAVHAAHHVLHVMGEKKPGEEFLAYLVGYLTDTLVNFLAED